MRIALFAAAAIVASLATPAVAQRGCADQRTQTGMNQCGSIELDKANGALQAVYDRLQKAVTPEAMACP